MSEIDYQALREIAKQATQGEWCAFISSDTGTYAVHTPGCDRCDDIIKWPGFDGQKNAENNARYIAAFNPKVVLALLDVLDASREAEPVAWTDEEELRDVRKYGFGEIFQCPPDKYADPRRVISLYREPPAVPQLPPPAVPGEIQKLKDGRGFKYVKDGIHYSVNYANGWNQCRAAMLHGKSEQPQNAQQNIPENIPGGNSPVIPDGWISCSERMPDSNCLYLCWGTYFEGDEPGYIPAYFFVYQTNGWTEWQPVEDDCNPREVIITHWMPLPAAPKQEVK
ncbi:ead/Ea22-like family protein [Salmonella enterica subsp. enterica serovar Pomona]|nr:DUF551 domain-containing protein [Salmonella enterica]EKG8145442.1 ead/Ea22-like family protein [Salmonella enterica subsp. enterica serovar Pomona]EDE9443710.1 DUF551 domain-containing protein [Salmonella enterica]EKG8165696.1 ead/Ea22-like family protein [Salmonella enterica subsp. enterica serovar Pomona]ELC5772179.1 ead/Ea22-like family protein [Salmonella enterica]